MALNYKPRKLMCLIVFTGYKWVDPMAFLIKSKLKILRIKKRHIGMA